MKGIIYKWTCNVNGKSYIGQTINEKKREKSFLTEGESYAGEKINNARKKYGVSEGTWTKTVLKRLWCKEGKEDKLKDRLNKWEKYYIEFYNTVNNGYNITDGGDSGYVLPDEVIKKLKHKGKEWWNSLSEERKNEIIGKSNIRYKEWRSSLGEKERNWYIEVAKKANLGKHNGHSSQNSKSSSLNKLGKKRNEETKRKISDSLKKRQDASKWMKRVKQYDLDKKTIVNEYNSILEASKNVGVRSTSFMEGIKRNNGYYRGWFWEIGEIAHGTTNPKGCYWIERLHRWRSKIHYKGKEFLLGHYENIEAAKEINEIARKEIENGNFQEWYKNIHANKMEMYKKYGEKIQN